MGEDFNLQEYLADGAEIIVKDAIKASLKNPKESLFLAKFAKHTRKASKIRQDYEKKGQNIPIFLIASITSSCNLHCTGCYSRANDACNDNEPLDQLSGDEWGDIFAQAKDLGISCNVAFDPIVTYVNVILRRRSIPNGIDNTVNNGNRLSLDIVSIINGRGTGSLKKNSVFFLCYLNVLDSLCEGKNGRKHREH